MLTGSALLSSRHYSLVQYFTARSLLRSFALTETWQWLCQSRYWAPVTYVCPVTHSFNLTFSNSERHYKNSNLNVKNRIICVIITPLLRLSNKFCVFTDLWNATIPTPLQIWTSSMIFIRTPSDMFGFYSEMLTFHRWKCHLSLKQSKQG